MLDIFYIILFYIGGALNILFSVLAWRLKNQAFFIITCVLTGLLVIYMGFNFLEIMDAARFSPVFFFLHLMFIGLPVFFVIKYFQDQKKVGQASDGLDGAHQGGEVTEEYLDEVINSPDEEIDFSEGVDLR
jgi:hypothetical protein